ncbi:FecR domain-containing protein [Chelatococcus reniformis]|uniref:Membrane protein n=1 Tax=Chelatococcus reniformis TaxID=1494448 RepID=A0A916U8W1_9HYPH|nr:FecR domain-containing protein [Chelatococcus reniformis]GGC64803.1 membrane protein [Chelatococcus reniformis]
MAPPRGASTIFVAAATATALAVGLGLAEPAQAQGRGCATTAYTDPPREVLSCPGGVSITARRDSQYRLIDRNRDGRPEGAVLNQGGLLVDTPPRRGPFQILTPHAIASVRGTTWAVDVVPTRTSVFVQTGAVDVRRPSGPAVVLRSGDGVDVQAGTGPLQVTRWGAGRAAELLGRFGR